jgi:chromosomal replication initiation ATPase DnaA
MTFIDLEINRIIRVVSDGTEVPVANMLSKDRHAPYVFARYILFRKLWVYGLTLQQIGGITDVTHAAVINGLRQYDALFKTKRLFRDMVRGVELVEALPR